MLVYVKILAFKDITIIITIKEFDEIVIIYFEMHKSSDNLFVSFSRSWCMLSFATKSNSKQ